MKNYSPFGNRYLILPMFYCKATKNIKIVYIVWKCKVRTILMLVKIEKKITAMYFPSFISFFVWLKFWAIGQ